MTPISDTIAEIEDFHTKITNRGAMNDDRLRTILLINALNNDFTDNLSSIGLSLDSTVAR